jgi:hypothetical protein
MPKGKIESGISEPELGNEMVQVMLLTPDEMVAPRFVDGTLYATNDIKPSRAEELAALGIEWTMKSPEPYKFATPEQLASAGIYGVCVARKDVNSVPWLRNRGQLQLFK